MGSLFLFSELVNMSVLRQPPPAAVWLNWLYAPSCHCFSPLLVLFALLVIVQNGCRRLVGDNVEPQRWTSLHSAHSFP